MPGLFSAIQKEGLTLLLKGPRLLRPIFEQGLRGVVPEERLAEARTSDEQVEEVRAVRGRFPEREVSRMKIP